METQKLAEANFKEIVLTGIHVESYGKDLNKLPLIEVIKGIGNIKGIERIRLSSLEPTLIDEDFMKELVDIGKVCDHFHLSLQSGSNSVLKRMNRKYTSEIYKEKVDIIRKYMPDAGITTDIIVGFPGETEEEFSDTYNFVKKIGFSRIHVFKYSPRKGTPAAKYENQIDGNIKGKRSDMLINLGSELTKEFNSKFINKNLDVLFEEVNSRIKDSYEGYTTNYIRTRVISDKTIIGEIKNIKIEDSVEEILIGNIE